VTSAKNATPQRRPLPRAEDFETRGEYLLALWSAQEAEKERQRVEAGIAAAERELDRLLSNQGEGAAEAAPDPADLYAPAAPEPDGWWEAVSAEAGTDPAGVEPAPGANPRPAEPGAPPPLTADAAGTEPAETDPDVPQPAERPTAPGANPQPTAPDPFRSGARGRPSAMELIEKEAQRRVTAGEVVPRSGELSKFAEGLELWWEAERKTFDPHGPQTRNKAIADRLRVWWNQHQVGKNVGGNVG
jgi:hypothetical protein